MREERLAGGQEPHAAGRALEERRAELVLERADVAADRRLRDAEALRGAAHVPFFRDGHEVLDLREAHAISLAAQIETVLDGRARARDIGGVVEILSPSEIERMRRAGRAAAETLAFVGARLRPGVTTAEIDRWVREDTAKRGGKPSQLGYKGFPAAVCTSRNSVVCHGIPSPREVLREGDIVNVDVTTNLDGYHGDTSATFFVGEPPGEARHVVEVARKCRDVGIAVVRDGARLGDIGAAIEEIARKHGCSVVRDFGGHGIGRKMHQEPHVSHVGTKGSGMRLRAGMALTVEPMINLGTHAVRYLDDGWTVVTADGKLSAQFEHTVIVTKDGYELTTDLT